MKRSFCLILLLVLFGATGPDISAKNETDSITVLSDSIVVTAKRFNMNREKSIWPVTIISHKHLTNQTSLSEAIDGKAGIDIRNYNGVGSVSTLSNWGLFNRHMLLLYNGRVVKDYSLGGFNLAEYSPDEFDRIEILKGPQSAFYGSDAVGGIINLITTSSFSDNTTFNLKQGSNGYNHYHLNFSRNLGSIAFGGYGEFTKTDNNRDNSGAEKNLYNLNGSYISKDNHHYMTISTRYYNDSLGVPGPVPSDVYLPVFGNNQSNSLYDHQLDENYSFDIQYRYEKTLNSQAQLDFFWEKKNVDYYNRYQDFFTMDTISSRSITNKRSLGISGRLMKSYSFITTAGGVDWLSGSVKGTTVDKFNNNSVKTFNFWEGRQNQFDLWSNLILKSVYNTDFDLSGRLQFVHNRKTQTSYNLGLSNKLNDRISLKFGFAYAFRLPSISEQYAVYPVEFYTGSNDKLNPETSRSIIITADANLSEKIQTSVTFFSQKVDSLIQYVPNMSWIYTPVNVELFKTRGVDINGLVQVNKNINLVLTGSYQRAKQSYNNGDSLAQAKFIPELKYRIDLNGNHDKFNYNVSLAYTSNRNTTMFNGFDYSPKVIPKVYELGLSFSYEIIDNLNGNLVIYDLTNEKRPDQFGFSLFDKDYPSPGRRFIFGLTYSL